MEIERKEKEELLQRLQNLDKSSELKEKEDKGEDENKDEPKDEDEEEKDKTEEIDKDEIMEKAVDEEMSEKKEEKKNDKDNAENNHSHSSNKDQNLDNAQEIIPNNEPGIDPKRKIYEIPTESTATFVWNPDSEIINNETMKNPDSIHEMIENI